jgi:pimeloyl-ACP methyl ester carboxylesterase
MFVRVHGEAGPWVIALHGGPGAPGGMAPVARGLSRGFHVLEPWQRASGGVPLTVDRHVEDLRELVASRCAGTRPALVGASWGAMLALAYAAAHPDTVGALVLVASGTFDQAARQELVARRNARMTAKVRAALEEALRNPDDEKLEVVGRLMLGVDSVDLLSQDTEAGPVDARSLSETWADMVRLQQEGVHPAASSSFKGPVLMLHGAEDPHPGTLIRDSLLPYLPQLEYREFARCGHHPWMERHASAEFFDVMNTWLARVMGQDQSHA